MKILIKYHNPNCKIESHGNWFDLKSSIDIELNEFEHALIPLGVSMKLPKYYQGSVVPRSGTFSKFGVIQGNHYGVVDGPDKHTDGYSGNNDIWKFSAIALRSTKISTGDRICQFEIRPTMKAPWWAKLKWIFDNKIEFIEVDKLNSKDRGGFGSTDKYKHKTKKIKA